MKKTLLFGEPMTLLLADTPGALECVEVDPDLAKATAELRLQSLFLDKSLYEDVQPLAIGQDVTLDLLTFVVMGVQGVKRVTWALTDVTVPKSGMAVLASLNLTAGMAEEA